MGATWPPSGGIGGPTPPFTGSVPAVSSYTVSHGRGTVTPQVTFYADGAECEVGVQIVDANSLDILQVNPSAGTVVIR